MKSILIIPMLGHLAWTQTHMALVTSLPHDKVGMQEGSGYQCHRTLSHVPRAR